MEPTNAANGRWLCFDLDGTLIDARDRQVEVTAWLLGELGAAPLDRVRLWRHKRNGATTAAALAALGYPPETVEGVAQRWPEVMECEEWLTRDRALPGAGRVLARLRRDGHRISVITARRRVASAAESLRAAGLHELVDDVAVVAPADAVESKAQRLIDLRAPWFIGDSISDGDAAKAAGVPFVAVATGQRSSSYLMRYGHTPAANLQAAVLRLQP